jgi:hypothetical protein
LVSFGDDIAYLSVALDPKGHALCHRGGLLIGSLVLASLGCALPPVLHLAVPGLVLLFALAIERWRYKPLTSGRPGPDWISTDERFVDPESGRLVTVFYKPSTGERRYMGG